MGSHLLSLGMWMLRLRALSSRFTSSSKVDTATVEPGVIEARDVGPQVLKRASSS